MKPQFEKIDTGCRRYLGSAQTIAEAQLSAKDSQSIKVLSISADPIITSSECLSGEASFGGRLTVRAVVSDGDGFAGLNYGVDFSGRFQNESITPDVRADFFPCVSDVSYKTDGSVVYVRCVIETRMFVGISGQTGAMTDCQDLNCKTETVTCGKEAAVAEKTFSVIDEIETKHKIGKVLSAQSSVALSSVSCDDGMVTAKGEIFTCIVYQTGERNVKSAIAKTPFEEEIEAAGADGDCVATAFVKVKNTRIHVEISEDEDCRSFTAENEITVKAVCFESEERSFVTDAFSLTEDVRLSTETLTLLKPENYFCFSQKIDGIAEAEGNPPVDEILCVANASAVAVSCQTNNGVLTADGVMSGSVIYLSGDVVSSLNFEIPFTAETDFAGNGACEIVSCAVAEASAKAVRGVVSVEADVRFGVNGYAEQKITCVTDAESLGEKQQNGCAIEILTAKKGMTSWDLQKYLGIPESDILACNPDVTLPLDEDRKILVYRQIK